MAGDEGLLDPVIGIAIKARHIGRGAAHVETDNAVMPGPFGRLGHADHAAGRSGQDRIAGMETVGRGQAAGRLHEEERRAVQPAIDAADIVTQDRGEIGIQHAGRGARADLHQGRGDRGAYNGGEARLLGQVFQPDFMNVIGIGMHQGDGERVEPVGPRLVEDLAGRFDIEPFHDHAVGIEAFLDLHHPVIERIGPFQVERENVGPGLVPDHEQVAEALGDQEKRLPALAFQQGIGGYGRAHLHRPDRRALGQAAHAFTGRVGIVGAFRQEFERLQTAIGRAADDVRERAAPVDPEFPFALHVLAHCHSAHGCDWQGR